KYLRDTKPVGGDHNGDEKDKANEEKTVSRESYQTDLSKLQHLHDAITAIMTKEKWRQIFVRMSIRSPKDAALSSQKETPPSDLNIKGLSKTSTREWIWAYNQRIIACYRAQTFALACENATEALMMLVKSPRIQGDMKSYVDGTYQQKFQLVVRQFEYFDVSFEFRTFIYKGKMTGLTQVSLTYTYACYMHACVRAHAHIAIYCTFLLFFFPLLPLFYKKKKFLICMYTFFFVATWDQYNDLCYFGDLVKYKDEIAKKLNAMIEVSVKKLEMENMVLDIVLVDPDYNVKDEWPPLTLERLEKLQVKIIEVNPLAEFAGGGLFEWNKDKDVLLGEKPFEFRMQTSLSAYTGADLMDEWKPFVLAENLD
ncbi:hypothetical protein RFI_08001, partial [Reticulomyxa filosa]